MEQEKITFNYFAMELILFKNDPLFIATLFALKLDPMPYTLIDKEDRVLILFKADIPPARMFRMGRLAADLEKAVAGVVRTYKEKYPHL